MQSNRAQIDQDLKHFNITYKIKTGSLIIITLALILILAGATGNGPLSKQHIAGSDGTVMVEYEKFLRYEAPFTIKIHLNTQRQKIKDSTIILSFPADYWGYFKVKSIVPTPSMNAIDRDRISYHFRVAKSSSNQTITFFLAAQKMLTTAKGNIFIETHDSVPLEHWIYP